MMIEVIAGTGFASVVAVVGYFLKKQNDKIDSVDVKLATITRDLKEEMKVTKKDMVDLFQDVCHERQGACSKLVDTKLENIKTVGTAICSKIEGIKADRFERWRKQELINDKYRDHMSKV